MNFLDNMFGSSYKLSDNMILFLGERFDIEFKEWYANKQAALKEAEDSKLKEEFNLEEMCNKALIEINKTIEASAKKHLTELKKVFNSVEYVSNWSTLSDIDGRLVSSMNYSNPTMNTFITESPDPRYVLKEQLHDEVIDFIYTFYTKKKQSWYNRILLYITNKYLGNSSK